MHYTLNCPGKINLFLEVQNKREDGYHNIGSIFQTVQYGDSLSAETSDTITLRGGEKIGEDISENLIVKAALKLKEKYEVTAGISFDLKKNLPVAAGLGGGSSNAASALMLCNKIWELDLDIPALSETAVSLGADIPFFLHGGCCFAEGIGEILSPAPPPYDFHIVIGTPACFVSTKDAYSSIPENRAQNFHSFKLKYLNNHKNPHFFTDIQNDFENIINRKFPEIAELHALISSFNPVKTMLCGSGASIFGLFTDKKQSESCLKKIRGLCRFSCITKF